MVSHRENSLTDPFNPLVVLQDADQNGAYTARLRRNEVSEIIGSYHHTFDHLYECIQNAVDACEQAFEKQPGEVGETPYQPDIRVTVNLRDNTITVLDDGVGMTKDVVLKFFFTPYATMKASEDQGTQASQRGEKGVGATFLSYGSDHVHVSTLSAETGQLTSCEMLGGLSWARQKQPLLPMPQVVPCPPHLELSSVPHGTAITVHFSDDANIARLSEHGTDCRQWEAILRLHTALGFVDLQDTNPFLKALRATITVIGLDGIVESKALETGYLFPHKTTQAHVRLGTLTRDKQGRLHESQRDRSLVWDVFTYDQIGQMVEERMGRTAYMRQVARDRISRTLNTHRPEAYVAFAYAAEFWDERNHDIWGDTLEGQLRHGIVFATKAQIIGEQMRVDFKFRSGDFNRFLLVISMRNIKADIGRKSLPAEILEFAQFFANAVQSRFVEQNDCLRPSPGPFAEGLERDLEDLKDSAFSRPAIPIQETHLVKVPQEEQDVIALFFDLLGAQRLKGYEIYSTHISRTYDGIGRFHLRESRESRYHKDTNPLGIPADKFVKGEVKSPAKCFIEFKYSTDDLVKDVRRGDKRLQDIKWLVCWEVGKRHIEEGVGILEITTPAQINRRDYYGVTHIMTEGQDKVHVICLQDVLRFASGSQSTNAASRK